MVTKKQSAVTTAQFSSIKDASYKFQVFGEGQTSTAQYILCLLYTSPSPRDRQKSRMPSSA